MLIQASPSHERFLFSAHFYVQSFAITFHDDGPLKQLICNRMKNARISLNKHLSDCVNIGGMRAAIMNSAKWTSWLHATLAE